MLKSDCGQNAKKREGSFGDEKRLKESGMYACSVTKEKE